VENEEKKGEEKRGAKFHTLTLFHRTQGRSEPHVGAFFSYSTLKNRKMGGGKGVFLPFLIPRKKAEGALNLLFVKRKRIKREELKHSYPSL